MAWRTLVVTTSLVCLLMLSASAQPPVSKPKSLTGKRAIQTFGFIYCATTGITSYIRVKGREKAILFSPRSNERALAAFRALKVDISNPNEDGKHIFVRGYLDPVVKYTRSAPNLPTSEPYQEFTLVGWHILTPFMEHRGEAVSLTPSDIRKIKHRRLRFEDFDDFEGKENLNVALYQRPARVRAKRH